MIIEDTDFQPVGAFRFSNLNKDNANYQSLISASNLQPNIILETIFCVYQIFFEVLNLKINPEMAVKNKASRVTFEGSYNADANISSDGKHLSLVHNGGNGHKIAVFSLDDKYLKIISNGRLDEAPSFAPNNKMILFASKKIHKGILVATSNDGRIRQEIELTGENVREPIWSH